jgi:hypothetical protein
MAVAPDRFGAADLEVTDGYQGAVKQTGKSWRYEYAVR